MLSSRAPNEREMTASSSRVVSGVQKGTAVQRGSSAGRAAEQLVPQRIVDDAEDGRAEGPPIRQRADDPSSNPNPSPMAWQAMLVQKNGMP